MKKENDNKYAQITTEQCKQILQKLVQINTCQPEGNEGKLADGILEMLPENIVYKKINHSKTRASLIIKVNGETEEGGIAFVGHMDTVACGDYSQWSYPPHDAIVKGDILYGRGSADMKGGDASMILALKWILETKKRPKYIIESVILDDKDIFLLYCG